MSLVFRMRKIQKEDRMEKSRMKEDVRNILPLQVEQILGTFFGEGD